MISLRRAVAAVATLLVAATLVAAGPRPADPPAPVGGSVSDPAGVLGSDASEVRLRLRAFADETGVQLYVVLVESFDGQDAVDWANRTAELSDLGKEDILLAVATQDRAYGISVTDGMYAPSELATVRTDFIEPDLRVGDWSQAALSAADGYTEMLTRSVWDGPWPWILGGGGLAVLVGLGARRSRRRTGAAVTQAAGLVGDGAAPTPRRVPTRELREQAGAALVALDDAVRSSAQELEFAKAEFGLVATDPFVEALAAASARLAEAFALRNELEAQPSASVSDRDAREASARVLALAAEADDLLDEQTESFAALRDLQARLDVLLPELLERAEEVRARTGPAQDALRQLRIMYPATALVSIEQKIPQATALLDTVAPSVEEGVSLVAGGSRRGAAARYRVAQEAVAHASTFLQDVHDAVDDLAASTALIAQAVASIEADLADAQRLAPSGSPAEAVPPAVEAAHAAIAAARAADVDPIAALDRLRVAEEALDAALAPAREREAVRLRVRERATQTIDRGFAAAARLDAFIQQHRLAVSEMPRARLASARQALSDARTAVTSDPDTALAAAQAAGRTVAEGDARARTDVGGSSAWATPTRWPDDSDDAPAESSGGGFLPVLFGGEDSGWGGSSRSSGSSWSSSSSRSSSRRSSSSRSRSSGRSSSSRRSSSSTSRSSRGRSGGGGRF